MPLFLRRHSPPLLPFPYLTCSYCHFCPLAHVCSCLSSDAISILVKPLLLSTSPLYISSCLARPPQSYLLHPSISSSLRFSSPPQYFIPTPPPSLSHSSIFIYINIYIYTLTHFLSLLSITHSLYLYISPRRLILPASSSLSHSLLLKSLLSRYLTIYLSHTHYLSNSLCLLHSLRLPHLHYALQKT